ncbi:MAG: GNAT family N-acetyltransferase, partial [Clostridiales bacterium]
EYEMFLRNKPTKNLIERKVVLRKAKNIDAKEIAKQNSIYFDMKLNEEDVSIPDEEEKCGLICYIAEVNNIIIGKVNISITNSIGGIYGLGVLPKYRKKGYGREILILSIEKLKEKDTKDIMLQVSVKNKNALNLYKSCGFKEVSTMDYYEIIK